MTPQAPSPSSSLTRLLGIGLALFSLASPALAEDSPAQSALAESQGKMDPIPVIQNRFFLKQNRFEIAPSFGYIPNNAFATNYIGGVNLAYHFTETFAVEGDLLYGPDTGVGGVKGLTQRLVDIAKQGNATTFQQPLDKVQLGAIFSARWAPVYGKINLLGETVVNFDLYGTGGVGLVLITKDYATYNDSYNPDDPSSSIVALESDPEVSANFGGNLGVGMNFFLNQFIALKLDARAFLYVADQPDYGNMVNGQPVPLEKRLYTPFITTVGVSVFVPKMKPRVFNF